MNEMKTFFRSCVIFSGIVLKGKFFALKVDCLAFDFCSSIQFHSQSYMLCNIKIINCAELLG